MKPWRVLRHDWSLKTRCCAEEASPKRPQVVWVHLTPWLELFMTCHQAQQPHVVCQGIWRTVFPLAGALGATDIPSTWIWVTKVTYLPLFVGIFDSWFRKALIIALHKSLELQAFLQRQKCVFLTANICPLPYSHVFLIYIIITFITFHFGAES